MHHYFITNRLIREDNRGEFINEDGTESAGENMRCGIFDSEIYDPERGNCREALTLFTDPEDILRTDAVNIQPSVPYTREDIDTPTNQLLGSSRLFVELYKAMAGEGGGDLLFFIHGFNNDLKGALKSVCDLEKKYITSASPIKHIVFFTWPAMNRLLRYRSDAKDAELSGYTLARCYLMLIDFFKAAFIKRSGSNNRPVEPCGHNIHLLCHSMGNRVLENMMMELNNQKSETVTALFKEVVLAASDVDWQVFESPRAFSCLTNICQRVTVYYNTKDLALLLSETTKNAYNRLGKYGLRSPHIPSHIYTVDCSGINDEAGLENKLVEHWYYVESDRVITDILMTLTGINAEDFVNETRKMIPGNATQYRLIV